MHTFAYSPTSFEQMYMKIMLVVVVHRLELKSTTKYIRYGIKLWPIVKVETVFSNMPLYKIHLVDIIFIEIAQYLLNRFTNALNIQNTYHCENSCSYIIMKSQMWYHKLIYSLCLLCLLVITK